MEERKPQTGFFEGQVLAKLDEIGRFMTKTEQAIEMKADRKVLEDFVKQVDARISEIEKNQRTTDGKLWWLFGGLAVIAFIANYVSGLFFK